MGETTNEVNVNPTEAMAILQAPVGKYPREAVQAAMEQRDEMVPLLLAQLERARNDAQRYLQETDGSFGPIHVLSLLGYHRVHEAHAHIVALASLPGELPFDIFGDAVNEILPKSMWQTSAGQASEIIGLIRNTQANEYCRASAIEALLFGVAEQRLSREEIVDFLQGLFTGEESTTDEPMIWNAAALALSELWPGESLEVLRKGYQDGLIESGYLDFDDIERDVEPGKEATLARFFKRRLAELKATPHDDLSGWAAFEQRSVAHSSTGIQKRKNRIQIQKAKGKRKQAGSARKKSRKKK